MLVDVHSFYSIFLLQVIRPLNQVLSSLLDQEMSQQIDNDNFNSDDLQKTYSVDEFEVRILEPDKSGHWDTKATVPMQTSENALTVRIVTLFVSVTYELFPKGTFSFPL